MDNKTRYKELIKENDQTISYLSNSYQTIALAYTKKARGFGVKSLDTEVKIKKVLEELTTYDTKYIEVNIAIPNMTVYIEEHIKLISKAPSKKYKIQEIIAVSLLILGIIGYFIINRACSKEIKLGEPINVVIDVNATKNNCFYLTWQANEYADNGYTMKIYKDDVLEKEVQIAKQVKDVSDEFVGTQYYQTDIIYKNGSVYKFEIYANATTDFGQSETTKVSYPS